MHWIDGLTLVTLLTCLSLASGCGDDGDTATDTTAASTAADTGPGTSSSTTAGSDSTGEPPSFVPEDPVMCEGVLCAAGQICLSPGLYCDTDGRQPEFVEPPDECADVPAECAGLTEQQEFESCLLVLCDNNTDFPTYSYQDGLYECSPVDLDCF